MGWNGHRAGKAQGKELECSRKKKKRLVSRFQGAASTNTGNISTPSHTSESTRALITMRRA